MLRATIDMTVNNAIQKEPVPMGCSKSVCGFQSCHDFFFLDFFCFVAIPWPVLGACLSYFFENIAKRIGNGYVHLGSILS